MNGRMHPLVAVVAIVSGAWGCAAPARGSVATVEPAVLIYCDKSPGVIPHAVAVQHSCQTREKTWVYATTSDDMVSRLADGVWSEVYVLMKHTVQEPVFASALRDYATANPYNIVQMFIWHDHNQPPAADEAVLGTTAIVTWHNNQTTYGYMFSGNRVDREQLGGHVFPDFSGVQTRGHTRIGEFGEQGEEDDGGDDGEAIINAFIVIALIDECMDQCQDAYQVDNTDCDSIRSAQIQNAYNIYGPGSNNPNIAKYNERVKNANTNHTACVSSAGQTFEDCLIINCGVTPGEGGGDGSSGG